jgi:hypothetical protein
MPDGALRVLHGDAFDVETDAGFLAPGQVLVLRMVVCALGRRDVIDALNADTGVRHRLAMGLRCAAGLAMPAAIAGVRGWRQRGGHRDACRGGNRSAGS